jgi:hypothetical protein
LLVFPGDGIAADEEGCLDCHGLAGLAVRDGERRRDLAVADRRFDASTHRDLGCRECHTDIVSIPHGERRVPGCGQPCHGRTAGGKEYSHEKLYWEYAASSHGSATTSKIGCLVCHPAPERREEPGRDKVQEAKRCASCHRGSARVRDWFSDRHFLALAGGNTRAPSCPDCHSSHRVRPSSSSDATVHPARLAETCSHGAVNGERRGACHGALDPAAVAGASMSPVARGKGGSGALALLLALLPGTLAAGLVVRAGIGFARGR